MLHSTHVAAGGLAAAAALQATQAPPELWPGALLLGAAAATLPDLDMPGSFAGRRVPVSAVIGGLVRHRTATHSLAATVLFAALLRAALVWAGVSEAALLVLLIAGVAGYLSHPLIDTLNPEGAQLLWPIGGKLSLAPVLPWPLTFTTGTWPEEWVIRPVLWAGLGMVLYRSVLPPFLQF